jgi:hypothetical protein
MDDHEFMTHIFVIEGEEFQHCIIEDAGWREVA